MSPPHEPHDWQDSAEPDPRLINYLLGLLPDEEAEPLDEASVADDQFAWRIRVSENELVDAYVSGTLPADTRQQFERVYLTSPRRREKVRLAEGLLAATSRAAEKEEEDSDEAPERVTVARFGAGAGVRTQARPAPFQVGVSKEEGSKEAPSGGASSQPAPARPALSEPEPSPARGPRLVASNTAVSWGCVAAAALLLVMAGTLVFQQFWLRDAVDVAQAGRASVEQRTQELERQLVDQRAAQTETSRELTRVRAQLAEAAKQAAATRAAPPPVSGPASRVIAASILLRPQTRAASDVPMLAIRSDTDDVPVTLLLDAQWFVRYRVTLKDPATGTTVWRSSAMTPTTLASSPVIALVIPSRSLRAQHYSLDLSGIGAAGAEPVGSYTFRIVRP